MSKTIKDKEKWLALTDVEASNSKGFSLLRKSSFSSLSSSASARPARPCRFPQIESEVVAWAREQTRAGVSLTDQSIKDYALATGTALNIPFAQFKASQGWLDRFKVI